ncbi:hypothetical protein [uncultured Thiohalocapsa sp.]|uniref:hypothetical protein n=1 Tax=uncultured Thiohalocapsa sp. TaxID=768990 RepID=UPI0025CFC6ED|nr:hypothetical protein [uncultured Thiohalocapsa sp.]
MTARCASRPANVTETSLLTILAADLQTAGVPPASAVDALISGRCGNLADVVSEVVARYGPEAAVPVIERAVARSGDAAALVIERAAAEGLLRADARRPARAGASPALGAGDDALLYLPSAGGTERPTAGLDRLLGNAEPGYGIYTYILPGDPADLGAGAHAGAYDELLRVLETYVLAAGSGGAPPAPSAHTFLVPVRTGRAASPLGERTSPELSALLRRTLAQYLRRAGEPALAARLATAPGPFLVSSLEPRLVPRGGDHVRMLVDLSGVGREYMYSVVDAYDRAIPAADAGRADSLRAVRSRLVGMFPDPAIDAAAAPPAAGDWVFMLARAGAGPSPPTGAVQQGR